MKTRRFSKIFLFTMMISFQGLLNSCQMQNEIDSSKMRKDLATGGGQGGNNTIIPELRDVDLWLDSCHLQMVYNDFSDEYGEYAAQGIYPSPLELCEDSEFKDMALEIYEEEVENFLIDEGLSELIRDGQIEAFASHALNRTVCYYREDICGN